MLFVLQDNFVNFLIVDKSHEKTKIYNELILFKVLSV